ncbi:hypothetical protein QTH90_00205 [Variovorax sp. J2P1-59]|uniref:hypothetical protein n=1 Tax=Variovorax flavidus TaxID=3053501 RepID=UPI002578A948|nr:hypothetical protein [Variovorax sp. J2P1-59]MDM0072786.1 hypothetical protein [Variovorax sp. J2P1-59]
MSAAFAPERVPSHAVARLLRAGSAVLDAAVHSLSLRAAFIARFDSHHDQRATLKVLEQVSRGTQSPAMTTVPEWAGALVDDSLVALVDLLAEQGNAALQLPFTRFEFAGRGRVRVPMRVAGTTKGLAGAFRLEGSAIRVGKLTLASTSLEPKSMAVIATSTGEMVDGAGDDVLAEVIRTGSAADTSRTLDGLVFDAAPADALRPAGLAALATGDNTAASTGTDAAAIANDLRERYDQLLASGFGGPSTRWVMNAGSAATLVELFNEVQTRDTYLRIPIVGEPTVPAGTVFLIDCAAVAFAADPPKFDAAAEAIVHEEDDPAAVAEDLSEAAPVRSLWQTNAVGFRTVWPMDWTAAAGSVQTLTRVAW